MEFRIDKAVFCLMLAMPMFAQDFAARHEHAKGFCQGSVTITPERVSYKQFVPEQQARIKDASKQLHNFEWKMQDIQQLEVSPGSLRVLAYDERMSRMGTDREQTFTGDFARAYLRMKDVLDQRMVVRLADEQVQPLWSMPVKQLGRIKGTEGELIFGVDRIVYKTAAKDTSRTWRYSDIDNISTSGPFQLTITTFERAKAHPGNLKGFSFQLKQPLEEARYNDLSRRLKHNKF
jgi:hypothetical protein